MIRQVLAAAAAAAAGLAGGWAIWHCTPARAGEHDLVYACSEAPCTNAQEFEVFDAYGNPIFSVGEYGNVGTFGTSLAVYPPGSVDHPALVLSYEPPARGAACVAPARWIAPQGTWTCHAGRWRA